MEELKKPFESEDSPVHRAGLSLVSIETRIIPCPQKEKWLKDGGDPMEHARFYVASNRRWSNATFIGGEVGSVPVLLQTFFGLVTQSFLSEEASTVHESSLFLLPPPPPPIIIIVFRFVFEVKSGRAILFPTTSP